jgi:hypothetical protein
VERKGVLNYMRDRRNTSPLLPKKLCALRKFLTVGEAELAASLSSDIRAQSGKPHNIKPGRISEYEQGLYEPNLLVLVAYARLAKVHLEFVIDDRFTLQDLRKQLGKYSS